MKEQNIKREESCVQAPLPVRLVFLAWGQRVFLFSRASVWFSCVCVCAGRQRRPLCFNDNGYDVSFLQFLVMSALAPSQRQIYDAVDDEMTTIVTILTALIIIILRIKYICATKYK